MGIWQRLGFSFLMSVIFSPPTASFGTRLPCNFANAGVPFPSLLCVERGRPSIRSGLYSWGSVPASSPGWDQSLIFHSLGYHGTPAPSPQERQLRVKSLCAAKTHHLYPVPAWSFHFFFISDNQVFLLKFSDVGGKK